MLGALWMLLSEYLPFFSYLNRPLPWGPTYHNPLMWEKFSLDFEKIMKIFRKKSEGDRKKNVFFKKNTKKSRKKSIFLKRPKME